jgi:hypothetical protein
MASDAACGNLRFRIDAFVPARYEKTTKIARLCPDDRETGTYDEDLAKRPRKFRFADNPPGTLAILQR